MQAWRQRVSQSAEDYLTQATARAARALGHAAVRDYRAAAILLKGRGLLGGQRAETMDPIAELRALPPQKRQQLEIRLRELILSFKESPPAPTPVEPKTEPTSLLAADPVTVCEEPPPAALLERIVTTAMTQEPPSVTE